MHLNKTAIAEPSVQFLKCRPDEKNGVFGVHTDVVLRRLEPLNVLPTQWDSLIALPTYKPLSPPIDAGRFAQQLSKSALKLHLSGCPDSFDNAMHGLRKQPLVDRLQQVINRMNTKCLDGVLVVSRHEYDGGSAQRIERIHDLKPIRVRHLNV